MRYRCTPLDASALCFLNSCCDVYLHICTVDETDVVLVRR